LSEATGTQTMHFNPNVVVLLVVLAVEYFIALKLFDPFPSGRERRLLAERGQADPSKYTDWKLSTGQLVVLFFVMLIVAGVVSHFGGGRAVQWFLNLGNEDF
jgi:hypothetical protein